MAKYPHIRCNWFDDKGQPLRYDGRLGCPRSASECFYIHPDNPIWASLKPARPRVPQQEFRDSSASQGRFINSAPRAQTPPRARSPPASSSFSRPRTSSVPRSPALSIASRTRSPRGRVRTPPRSRSPPSGPRSASRPRSRTPVRHTEPRSPSPKPHMSREKHASGSDARLNREHANSSASSSAPPRRQDSSYSGSHRDPPRAVSPPGSRPSGSSGIVGRPRAISGASASSASHRQGSVPSERMRDQSPTAPATPVAPTNSMDGRFRPISLGPRAQMNGVRAHTPSHSSSMPPPPVPSMPPPPTPPLSSTSSDHAIVARPPPRELSYTEKRDLWVERIKLLTDATIARAEYLKLTQEVEKYQRLVRSARYNSISEEDQARLDAQLSEVNGRLDAKKSELNSVLPRLIDADFWGATVDSPPSMDEFRTEVHTIISELNKNMQRLHEQYEELRTKATVASETPMEIDAAGWHVHEGPPAKRRRLSIGEANIAVSEDDRKPNGDVLGGGAVLHDRVLNIEARVTDIENEIVERDQTLHEEVEELVRLQVEEHRKQAKAETRSKSPASAPKPPPHNAGLQRVEAELATTGSQVEEVAIEVASLITQMDARNQEHARLAKENQLLRDRIAVLEQLRTADAAAIEATKAEIKALSAAVQSYITQAPAQTQPVPLQQIPTLDEILSRIHPSLIQSLHEDIEPRLLDTHGTIRTMLQEQLNNVYTTLLSKMNPTMKTVDVVAAWMERVRRGEAFVDNPVQSHNSQ
ncbi:uncharacterized protein B0H18DRAFT_977801 [Fomitopsis serialis]|uniref:uncharacterized protein n=1 Tax=Fomitopsis serialis TaxID=139415 RepID=UPI002008D212|nr:uncharacterized protein B0H18DRAFT_977801 [Neoantrodia serialis]KAH9934703.1 hypothetical protein B0H18DRAFT_977801 [Neoantrodia serialis]